MWKLDAAMPYCLHRTRPSHTHTHTHTHCTHTLQHTHTPHTPPPPSWTQTRYRNTSPFQCIIHGTHAHHTTTNRNTNLLVHKYTLYMHIHTTQCTDNTHTHTYTHLHTCNTHHHTISFTYRQTMDSYLFMYVATLYLGTQKHTQKAFTDTHQSTHRSQRHRCKCLAKAKLAHLSTPQRTILKAILWGFSKVCAKLSYAIDTA